MEIVSSYIDHNFLDEKIIGEYFQNNTYDDSNLAEHVCVNTCHRVEYYSVTNIKTFSIMDVDSRYTKNSLETAQRLIELLTGVQSVILGEPYIRNQFVNAFSKSKNKLLSKFFTKCLEISDQIRNKYDFYNHKNYTEIAIDILSCNELLVIGGGMLIQNIASNYNKKLYVITRNPKKFKKNIIQNNNITVSKIENAQTNHKKCVIATSTNDFLYTNKIKTFLEKNNIEQIIDLSSVPINYNIDNCNYITMYDKNFKQQIEESNKLLLPKVLDIKKTIQQTVINQYRDLI